MRVNGFRKAIVLFALVLLFAESAFGNEPLKGDASEKEEVAVPLQNQQSPASEKVDVVDNNKAETAKENTETPVKDNNEELLLKKLGIDAEKVANVESESAKDAKVLAKADVRRLARFLRNFHQRQVINGDGEVAYGRKASSVSEDDEDAVAEERAVRRRKRIRRRKIYSNIGQRHRNSNNAIRKRTSYARRKNSSVRGGNVKNPSRRSGGPRRPSNGNKHAYRKGNKKQSNRKSSKQKRKKNKKSSKNKNKGKKPQEPSSENPNSIAERDQPASA